MNGSGDGQLRSGEVWNHAMKFRLSQADLMYTVQEFLEMYGECKDLVLVSLKHHALESIRETNQKYREVMWKYLLAFEKILGGATHEEYLVYKIWWQAVFAEVKSTKAELEWDPETGDCTWGCSVINREVLKEWVSRKIAFNTPGGQILSRLRQLRTYVEHPSDQKRMILDRYLRELEDMKDFAKRWWTLVRQRSLPIEDLAGELERMRKTTKNQQELKVAIRSMAGRDHQRSALMDPRLELSLDAHPMAIAKMTGTLRMAGIRMSDSLEKEMNKALQTSTDQGSCMKALKDMKDH
jgi:hypothetical protein